jgi:hypothetical protein
LKVWEGCTPGAMPVLVEYEGGRWIATFADVSQSRRASLEEALVEASGGLIERVWARQTAEMIKASLRGLR